MKLGELPPYPKNINFTAGELHISFCFLKKTSMAMKPCVAEAINADRNSKLMKLVNISKSCKYAS